MGLRPSRVQGPAPGGGCSACSAGPVLLCASLRQNLLCGNSRFGLTLGVRPAVYCSLSILSLQLSPKGAAVSLCLLCPLGHPRPLQGPLWRAVCLGKLQAPAPPGCSGGSPWMSAVGMAASPASVGHLEHFSGAVWGEQGPLGESLLQVVLWVVFFKF